MKVLTDNKYYGQIADVIREQNGTSNTYTPPQMVSALKDLFYEEVEGVPPITFQGIGENLLDYRIDGASGGVGERTKNLCPYNKVNNSIIAHVESGKTYSFSLFASFLIGFNLMKRNASSQSTSSVATKYSSEGNVSATFTADEDFDLFVNGFSLISGKTFLEGVSNFQLEESSTVTDYEPYGYKVPVMVEGKNLLQNTATSQTINGLTFTVNTDGSVTCNGRRENTTTFFTIANVTTSGKIILSGCPSGGSSTSFAMRAFSATVSNPRVYYDIGDSCMLNTPDTYNIDIRIQSNYACDNLTFYPMIRKADIEDDTYEPYIEPTTTNIYLDKPIDGRANIPSEYEEVEYIESTGTQYINTGIKTNTTNSRYETKINPSSASGTMGVFGTRNDFTTVNQTSMNVFIIDGNFRLDWLSGTSGSSARISTNTEYEISITRGLATINNVNYTSGNTTSINGSYPFYVGTFNNAGSAYSNGFSGKIYYSKLYNNNILVFDGVPCYRKSDNEIGMYDLVSNTFFTNAGTGNFIVGPIKENESISLSDTNTNIPTIRGTNILTVDTTVQPSNVYVKSRHESSYETAMRERYEEAQAQLDALESEGE